MSKEFKTSSTTIYFGDCLKILKQIPDMSVQMCVTSPPYWNLRDYGCEGQIGLEKTVEEYVSKLVKVFRQIKRVFKNDGTLWLNLGDSYAGCTNRAVNNYKKKDLIGIPWLVAFALRKDGWYLRQDIIWHKPNTPPESVTDRCTKAHEYIFLFSKSRKYYFDLKAILEKASSCQLDKQIAYLENCKYNEFSLPGQKKHTLASKKRVLWRHLISENGIRMPARQKRSVWSINTSPYRDAHFATYPPELVAPCILAGSKRGDIIIDPFIGSGTTAQVAESLGRKCIGIELNEDYLKFQKKRLAQPYLNI